MKSWEARSGRSVLIFSEESDFQGPGVQKDPKLEIRKIAGVPKIVSLTEVEVRNGRSSKTILRFRLKVRPDEES